MRYKKLPYELVPIGFSDIERIAKEVGAPPTDTSTPTPKYTVPFIKDSTTGKVVSDSTVIAQYLDEAYPDTPPVIPEGSLTLQKIFLNDVIRNRISGVHRTAIRPVLSQYFPKDYQEVAKVTPTTPEQVAEAFRTAQGQLAKLNEILNGGGPGPFREFVMGAKPVFADFAMMAFIYPIKFVYGADSDEWKEVRSWANGWIGWLIDGVDEVIKVDS